ncbi:MAG TPA: hypothetical protein VNV44_09965 [Solirubrobacteraceae bacterium]|jgi:hypothetical protein|nr:hypothetical protein [Solirubrobacteraceae bacterium]
MESSTVRRRRVLAPSLPALCPDIAALIVLIAAATVVYLIYGLRVGLFQNDEQQYMEQARYVATHFPSGLFASGVYPRGPQRLDAWLMAIPFAISRGPKAFELAHALQALLFASTALPVFLLGARAGLGRAGSVFAATLSLAVPWAIVSTSYLAEPAAYPAYAWVLYLSWMVVERPSLGREVLLVVAVAAAALARTQLLTLIPLAPLAALVQEWRYGLPGAPLGARARDLGPRMWRRHPLITVVIVLGVAALLADTLGLLPGRGLSAAAGGYGVPRFAGADVLVRYRDFGSRVVVGTGFLTLMLALPWMLVNLVRPRTPAAHVTALVCLLGLLALVATLLNAGPDERYLVYSAVPLSVLACASLAEAWQGVRWTRSAAALTLASAAGAIALIAAAPWPALTNVYDYFAYPGAIFYQRAILEHFGSLHSSVTLLVALVLGAIALAWTTLRYRGIAVRQAVVVLAAAILAVCLVELVYGLRKFTQAVGGPHAAQRSWVDASVPAGAQVGALAVSLGETLAYTPVWRETEFWNTSVTKDVLVPKAGALPLPLGSEVLQLQIHPNGRLTARRGIEGHTVRAVPRYMLVPQQGTNRLALNGKLIGVSSYLPLELVRLDSPPAIRWSMRGTDPEGFITPGRPVVATAYPPALTGTSRSCASFSLLAPPGYSGRLRFTVSSGSHVLASGGLLAGQTLPIKEPVHAAPGSSATVSVTFARRRNEAVPVKPRIAFFEAGPCAGG